MTSGGALGVDGADGEVVGGAGADGSGDATSGTDGSFETSSLLDDAEVPPQALKITAAAIARPRRVRVTNPDDMPAVLHTLSGGRRLSPELQRGEVHEIG